MDTQNLTAILAQYVARFEELNEPEGNNEGYKWDAVTCFQENWNIEAEDFQKMYLSAMKETDNLMDNGKVQPIGGISLLLKQPEEVEFVRQSFRDLFTEDGGDLANRQKRAEHFVSAVNEHIERYVSGSWKYRQKLGNAIYYLNLWRPDENYIYKSVEAAVWADCIEYGDDFGVGASFSLAKYYKMCDELLAAIQGDEELLRLNAARTAEKAKGYDDKLHILVYDIIYCARTYLFYEDSTVDIIKVSKKERIKKAALRKRLEELELSVEEVQAEQADLEHSLQIVPDMTGLTVFHKKFGTGTVAACTDSKVAVRFGIGEREFQFPAAFLSGFLTPENRIYTELFEKNAQIKKQLDACQAKLKLLNAEIAGISLAGGTGGDGSRC